jgi:putative transposase
MKQVKGFTTKISNLNKNEQNHLEQLFGINRLIWNICLSYKKELWETYKRRNPCVENKEELKLINSLRHRFSIEKELAKKRIRDLDGYDFLLTCPARGVVQCVKKLDAAYEKFYKGQGEYPKFKKKSGLESIHLDGSGKVEKVNSKYIKITTYKMEFIVKNPIKGNNKIFSKDIKICSITLSRKPNGIYYISVNYSYEQEEVKKVKINKEKSIGIDRGVTTTATCSNGKKFNIKPMNKINDKIKFYQKQISKKRKGSNNRNKVRVKIAKLHHKKANIKKDFNHKLSHFLVKNHDLIVLENLKVKDMTKSFKGTLENPGSMVRQKSNLNRSILENNWGQLKQFIEYKSNLYGKHLVLVNPKNTSRRCSNCFHVEKDNRSGKKFHCQKCGHKQDADLNASINIKEDGLSLLACGEIELSNSMKQELETALLV